jgi:hypothetical protein
MVKILAIGAVSAGQRPDGGRGISTDSARPVRDECRFPSGPRLVSSVVQTHAKSHREPASGAGSADCSSAAISEVHFGADLPVCRRPGHPRLQAAARGRAAHGPDTRECGNPGASRCRADTAACWAGRDASRRWRRAGIARVMAGLRALRSAAGLSTRPVRGSVHAMAQPRGRTATGTGRAG